MATLKPGRYRHFKGNDYEVLFVGIHTETDEEFVIYRALYGSDELKSKIWIRPLNMFTETVRREGKTLPRFQFVD